MSTTKVSITVVKKTTVSVVVKTTDASPRKATSPRSAAAAAPGPYTAAGDVRLSSKRASDAFRKGNNAGMLFRKEARAATTPREFTEALVKLRMAECRRDGDLLRGYFGE
jgi:hypothetical protein